MSDLAILYYSACKIHESFAQAVRAELVRSIAGRYPIVSITHRPTDFGDVRIVVGDVTPSIAQVYKNILTGCYAATTTYCAAAEDDSLYVPEHWEFRPPLDTFAYNERRAVITRRLSSDGIRREAIFYERPRTQMAMGIFSRTLMIEALEEKFAKYPEPPLDTTVAKKAGWGEPGRYEKNLKLTPRKIRRQPWTSRFNVTVNHAQSLMGRRALQPDDHVFEWANPWGNADDLWRRIHG